MVGSPSLEGMWHSLLWVGIAHSLNLMVLELFLSGNGSGILIITTFLHTKQPQEQVENMISV